MAKGHYVDADPKTGKSAYVKEHRELEKAKDSLTKRVKELDHNLKDEKKKSGGLESKVKKLEAEVKQLKTEEAKVKSLEADVANAKKAEADAKKAEAQAQTELKKVQLEKADLEVRAEKAETENAELQKALAEAEAKANAVTISGASELDIANGTVGEHTEYGFAIEIPGKGRQVIKPDDAKIEAIVTSYGEGVGKKSWWWVKEDGTVDDTQGDNGVPTIGQLLNLKKL